MFYIYFILLCVFFSSPSNKTWMWRRLMCISRSVSHHHSVLIRIENHSWCFAHCNIFRWKLCFFSLCVRIFLGVVQSKTTNSFYLFVNEKHVPKGKCGYARYCVFKLQLIFFCERSITTQTMNVPHSVFSMAIWKSI